MFRYGFKDEFGTVVPENRTKLRHFCGKKWFDGKNTKYLFSNRTKPYQETYQTIKYKTLIKTIYYYIYISIRYYSTVIYSHLFLYSKGALYQYQTLFFFETTPIIF